MENPRTTDAGPADARASTDGMLGSTRYYLPLAGPGCNSQIDPCALDRRADLELFHGRHKLAEALSHRAAELRLAGAA